MSDRRSCFYNTKSWQRYLYACFLLNQFNKLLRNGYSIITPEYIFINPNDRFLFTKDNYPCLYRTLGRASMEINLMSEKDGFLYISKNRSDISNLFKGYRKMIRNKKSLIRLNRNKI